MFLEAEKFGRLVQIISTNCSVTSYSKLGHDLADWCQDSSAVPISVDFTNVHIVALRDSDQEFREVTDSVDLFIPDSMVLKWAVNLRGGEMIDRVYGPSFLSHMIENTSKELTHYFLGGSQECLDKLLENIRERNPDFRIAGSRNGYFDQDEEKGIIADINEARPDLLWVGLGTPKQQEWISRFKNQLKSKAVLAVGFAFDVNAGTKRDAPPWMQKSGLTWFYRLLQEPGRLWERYLIYNSIFVHRLFRQMIDGGLNGCLTTVPESEVKSSHLSAAFLGHEVAHRAKGDENSFNKLRGKRSDVLGVGISPVDLPKAIQLVIDGALEEKAGGKYVTVTGVHGIMESQRDLGLKKVHNSSFLSVPDGMPMVWVGKWNGFSRMARVYGPDLMLGVAKESAPLNLKHFFYGGKEGIAQELSLQLESWYPGVESVGTVTPPFRKPHDSELDELVAQLDKTQPHFLWIGLGTPKQEKFMSELLERYPNLAKDWPHSLVMLGVGAAFDFHTGRLAQAPRWMQTSGLEWFFRLLMEPRRLFRRYSINNSTFIWSILQQMTGVKEFNEEL